MFSYLLANNFIEHDIQKGFTPHISGTLEHTAQMAYIINQARIRQRSLIITLLDLKNAFGEVHHNLIKSVLGYHHIPDHIQLIIESLYTQTLKRQSSPQISTPHLYELVEEFCKVIASVHCCLIFVLTHLSST